MKLFYECNFFREAFVEQLNFDVFQQEIRLQNLMPNNKAKFKKFNVKYSCAWSKQKSFNPDKPAVIIPTKNQEKMMKFTCKNLISNKIPDICNVIIVDDRSTQNIKKIAMQNNFSYLRIDNEKGFNFSMLNNIPAKLCSALGVEQIVLWNSDLWCADGEKFAKLLEIHNSDNSVVSGTKLLYPPETMFAGETTPVNILSNFPSMANKTWRETVQFGGDAWVHTSKVSPINYSPIHFKRFAAKNNSFVNCNRGSSFLTGALQLWDLKTFLKIGGLNPSLSKNFQDVDICLKVLEANKCPMYYGKDLYFYHDESPTMNKEGKNDIQMTSDHHLFGKIWNDKITSLVF